MPERPGATHDIRFLDDTELDSLIAAVPDDAREPTERAIYLTATMTGLRQGGLLGLRWQDIDWRTSRVRVRRSFLRGDFSMPKARRSNRSVLLADEVARRTRASFPTSTTGTSSSATRRPATRSIARDCSSVSRRPGRRRISTTCDSTASATPSARAWPARAWRCEHCRSGCATATTTTEIYADYQPNAQEADLVRRAFAEKARRLAASRSPTHPPPRGLTLAAPTLRRTPCLTTAPLPRPPPPTPIAVATGTSGGLASE